MKQKKFMTMKRLQERDNVVSNRQDNDLWVKIPSLDTEKVRDKILMIMN